MSISLEDLRKIFDMVPQDPQEQNLFLELSQKVADKHGVEYLSRNKGLLLNQWDYIVKELF